MQKIGGMSGILGMMPGVGKMKKQLAAAGLDDSIVGRQLAIISSMTRVERQKPALMNGSRRKRIAAGSGTDVAGREQAPEDAPADVGHDEEARPQQRRARRAVRRRRHAAARSGHAGAAAEGRARRMPGGLGGFPADCRAAWAAASAACRNSRADCPGLGGGAFSGLPGLGKKK